MDKKLSIQKQKEYVLIATSAYHKSKIYSFDEWYNATQLIKHDKELKKLQNSMKKDITNYET